METTQIRYRTIHRDFISHFRTPNILAAHPAIGLSLFLIGLLIFGGLTYNLLSHGPLLKWDTYLANVLPAMAVKNAGMFKILMNAGFYIGEQVEVVIGIILGVLFIRRKYWEELSMLAIGMAGSTTLFLALSHIIQRPRPLTQLWIIVKFPSYPSGHAIGVVTFYGLLCYLLVPKMPSTVWKIVTIMAAVLIVLFVGFTRIFTGGHYLTDVLAGYAVGLAWFGVVFTLIEISFNRRKDRIENG